VGALSVNSTTLGRDFHNEDLNYIKQLADFAADIIRTSKQFEQSTHSAFALSLLESVRTILNLDYSFDERLNLLLLRVANTLNGEICNYYAYNQDERAFYLKASSSFKTDLAKGRRMKFNDQLAKKVLDQGETVCVDVVDAKTGVYKWYIAHPVRIRDEMCGLLFLHLVCRSADVAAEKETVATIGDLLATELTKDVQIESSRIKSEKLSAISEATFDLASARTLEELAQVVVTVACLVLEAESCVIRVHNRNTGKLDILDSFSLRSSQAYREIQALDAAIAAESFRSTSVLLFRTAADFARFGAKELRPKSGLSMCLQNNGRRFGTLSIYDKTAPDFFGSSTFSQSDRDVFLNVCLQAAKALDRFVPLGAHDM
jgi:GAF domain-containing protein